jgi:hypothetical protein
MTIPEWYPCETAYISISAANTALAIKVKNNVKAE